jgi:hypothetical protein
MDLTSAMKRCIRNDSDGEVIDKINLPAGLKELLVGHGFTINQLLCMKSDDIDDILGIDQDAARLIVAITQIGNNFGYLHGLHFSAWCYFCYAIY